MKKGTVAALAAAVAALAALGLLTLFLAVRFRAEMQDAAERSTQAEADAKEALQAIYASGAGDAGTAYSSDGSSAGSASQDAGDQPRSMLTPNDTPVIWVGDSRTVGMETAVNGQSEDIFIAASGEGYQWLSETGLPKAVAAIEKYPSYPVIFNMGVNDYENLENYLKLYAELTAEYPDTVFYFLAVYPVVDEMCQFITNAMIEDFNAHLLAAYPDTFLDSYSFLTEIGAETSDGIHYSSDVYRQIYIFVKEILAER